jgi:hypothetical protein
MTSPRPIVDLAEKFVACLAYGLAEVGSLRFRQQVSTPIVQLDDDVMSGSSVGVLDPDFCAYFFFEVLQAAVDLFEISFDSIYVRLSEAAVWGRNADPHHASSL